MAGFFRRLDRFGLMRKIIGSVILLVISMYIGYSASGVRPYFEVHEVATSKNVYEVGEVIALHVNRTIKKDFPGSYTVTVLKVEGDTTRKYCSASQHVNYATSASLPNSGTAVPEDLNLAWWVDRRSDSPACDGGFVDEPGDYYIRTCWIVHRQFTFSGWTCKNSNTFRVE